MGNRNSMLVRHLCLGMMTLLFSVACPAPATAAEEVNNLSFEADGITLEWEAEPLADSYVLYRGYVRHLDGTFFGTALEGGILETAYADAAIPPRGYAFFYLVTATDTAGEGPLGQGISGDGATLERSNLYPWLGLAVTGRWSEPRSWPMVAVHLMVLHTGKVFGWGFAQRLTSGFTTDTFLWDPLTDQIRLIPLSANIFCAGHSQLPDGRILVTGGQIGREQGPRQTFLFDPVTETWSAGPEMHQGRYYPTQVALGDGRTLIFSGTTETAEINPDVEAFVLRDGVPYIELLPNASRPWVFYPMMHLLPSGLVSRHGSEPVTYTLDPATESWQFIARSSQNRGLGNSVLLPGFAQRVMLVGGIHYGSGDNPNLEATANVEIIDFSDPVPSYRFSRPLRFGRMNANAVILPDTNVVLLGGGTRYEGVVSVYPSEIFDPATETWTMAATQKTSRRYHSSATLLPDGRVMSAGDNNNLTADLYSPGYLFRGPRPIIVTAPAVQSYGGLFHIDTPDPSRIASVVLVNAGAATHALSMGQLYVPLEFTPQQKTLEARAPSNRNAAPPGYYMLFIVDSDGVPSEARFIRLE